MLPRRPLRFVIFALDAFRLAAALGALAAIRAASPDGRLAAAAGIALAAPQALFVLLALFFSLDPIRFAAYAPLYAAGKAVSAVALAGFVAANWRDGLIAFATAQPDQLFPLLALAGVLAWDAVSVAVALAMKPPTPGELTPDMANRPNLVVDVLPEMANGDSSVPARPAGEA
jgi:hypothetical protein